MRAAKTQTLNLKLIKEAQKKMTISEDTVPINETSEQNSNGYCIVDFVFTFSPTHAFLYVARR